MVLLALAIAGCGPKDAEPGPRGTTTSTGAASMKQLGFTAPARWNKTESSPTGARRAGFSVPATAGDKEDAEVLVLFFGTGSNGDRDKNWEPWFKQFDGDAKSLAKRETFTSASGLEVETFEHVGTYKLNLGPHRPGMTASPMQMVKENFRMIAAVIHTPDRGNWFVRMVGPDATVLAARDELLTMLKGVE
ncbi:MAG: hypothetical protein U0271_24740 [Polyangiaceae bacterium]